MNMDESSARSRIIQGCNFNQDERQIQEQDRQYQQENLLMDDAMKEKRKSEVMIAAQSLDNEVQSVTNLKRISIGSMDMLMDPELEYRVSSNGAGRQGGRKSWTPGIPTRSAEDVSNTHNRAIRYTYPSRAEPDESFESELSEISFELTKSEYLGHAGSDNELGMPEAERDTSDLSTSSDSRTPSFGRRISGAGTLKRGASNIPSRKNSSCSDNGSNPSLTKNLLWVPANQHPNVKPENYLELVQDTLHNIKLEGDENNQNSDRKDTETAPEAVEYDANRENEDHGNRPRRNSSLVRKPSRLRKSYTEFDGDNNSGYQDVKTSSKQISSEDLEDTSNLTVSSTTSSRTVSLRDITDELTKISNNAGLTDSDAVTLARTLSMAGSFTSDESDVIENSREEPGSASNDDEDNELDGIEKKEDDAEFASTMIMKSKFVIPARSSLRRSKFTTYRVKSPGEENSAENKSPDVESHDRSVPTSTISSSRSAAATTETYQEETNPRSPQKDSIGTTKDVTGEETKRASNVRHQDHLATPGDQYSRGSKSPSQFIGDDGSNLTSPSTISDFQDIYDHYRQSSVDWEKELKKEHDLAQQADGNGKPFTTEVHIDSPALEESSDVADNAGVEVITKEDILLSTEISNTDDPIELDDEQSLDNELPELEGLQENTENQQNNNDSITTEIKPEAVTSGPHPGGITCNRQVEKRGGWAFFNIGDKNILGEDQYSSKEEDTEDTEETEEHQLDKSVPQDGFHEGGDFIKTSTNKTDRDHGTADRSNHSKNRHSPIFTEDSKREIMQEPEVTSQVRLKNEESRDDTDGSTNKSSNSSNTDSSNSFSAQKLEKKFVNLFKRKGKNKSSNGKPSKAHKKLDLTKKTANSTLPKFKRVVKNQVRHADASRDERGADLSSNKASPEIALGQPVDDTVTTDATEGPSEVVREEPLSLQPAVSVQSTKSVPTVVVGSSKQQESQSVPVNVVDTQNGAQNVQKKRQVPRERRRERKQQHEQQQPQKRQQVAKPPSSKNEPEHLPPRKLTFSDVKRLSRPNGPMKFSDSAFGFPLPMLTVSTVIMFDHRLPINVERAIYRLSHLKLSDPKRELRQQVMLSNFMYAYLNLVNHTLYMEQVAQETEQELQAASENDFSVSTDVATNEGSYTTNQNESNGSICIPDIQG